MELHKGTAEDRNRKVEELNNMVDEFTQRYQVSASVPMPCEAAMPPSQHQRFGVNLLTQAREPDA